MGSPRGPLPDEDGLSPPITLTARVDAAEMSSPECVALENI